MELSVSEDQRKLDEIERAIAQRDLALSFEREKMASTYLRHHPNPDDLHLFIAGAVRFGYLEYDGKGNIRETDAARAYKAAREHSKQVEINYFVCQEEGRKTREQVEAEWKPIHDQDDKRWAAAFEREMLRLGREPRIF